MEQLKQKKLVYDFLDNFLFSTQKAFVKEKRKNYVM